MAARAWLWLTVALTCSAFVLAVALAPVAANSAGSTLVASTRTALPGQTLAWILFIGSSVHVASTGWLYTQRDVRSYVTARPARYLWTPCALVAAAAVLAVALPPGVVTWLLLPFFGWQFFHFAKQNLGMVALAASSSRVLSLNRAERRVLVASGLAGFSNTARMASVPGLVERRLPAQCHPQ